MKIGMVSLGCPKNLVDSEVMMGLLKKAGHTPTSDEAEAEAIIVNTCSFIREATEESIGAVLEMAALKDSGRLKHLIVAGCMAQRYREGLLRELPEVDAYVGTGEFERLPAVLRGLVEKGPDKKAHSVPEPAFIYSHSTPRLRFTPRHWGYIKIAEGCDNRCRYCMIPSLRGGMRSRPVKSIKAEAEALAARGMKEACIIAQDTTAYGSDLAGSASLAGLLGELEGVRGLKWIRVLYTHPGHFTPGLVEFLAGSEKTLSYLDVPLQHIDDEILASMGRKTTSSGIRRLVERLRKKIPGLAIRTSFMVGYPGETREKFMGLLRFVKEAEFDHVGVFGYSDEEGAASHKLPRKVSDELISERRDRLMKAQAKVSLRKNRSRLGRTYKVLVDGPSRESELLVSGRAYFQAPEIDGVIYITDGEARPGEFAEVEITQAHDYDLAGRILE